MELESGRYEKWRVFRVCNLSVAIILLACSSAPSVAQSRIPVWSGTWAASPVRDSSGRSFTQQTLRQIIHTSVGGQIARIHVSNVFGTQPLTIEDVHIALRSNGSSIIASTDRRIMFSGLTTATIQPGSVVISDPIEFPVPPLSDVAISIYFPKPTGRATFHPSGFQTSYIANGDATGNIGLSKVDTTQSSYFLTNLDVQHQAILGSVIALGASITDGYSSAPDANRRWPNDLAQRLVNSGITVGVLNQGISGNRLLSEGAGDSAETRFDRDVLEQPGRDGSFFLTNLSMTSVQPLTLRPGKSSSAASGALSRALIKNTSVLLLDSYAIRRCRILDSGRRNCTRTYQQFCPQWK